MAQLDSRGLCDDGVIRFADGVLRAGVVVVLLLGYVDWLGRSPVPALVIGGGVAVLVRSWRRVPWVGPAATAAPAGRRAALAEVDLMTGREFQQLVAELLRRDDVADVRALGVRDDVSMDVLGLAPTGHRVVVRCSRDARSRRAGTADVERFLATLDGADEIAVLVSTGRFTRAAVALGERRNVVLLDRTAIAAWMAGRTTPFPLPR